MFGQASASRADGRPFVAYHASWYEPPATSAEQTTLARLPRYISIVMLGFARPDTAYDGGDDLAPTGLQYPFSRMLLGQAISALKKKNPETKVLVAVGGSGYPGWDRLNEAALVSLVRDIGADGIDVDFEPRDPDCRRNAEGQITCSSDAQWRDYVSRIRKVLPRPYMVTVPGWSVGAYGEGRFINALPKSPWTGIMLPLLRSAEARDIDLVSIMAYDAGPSFSPIEALKAYRSYWPGPLALGIPVMPPTHGEARLSARAAQTLMQDVAANPRAGAMLYALRETPPGHISPDNPDAAMLARAICLGLGLSGCDEPVP